MQKIIDDFFELVQIDASSKNERAVADAVTKKLKALGCHVWEDTTGEKIGGNAGNIYAVLDGSGNKSIFFSSHLDRVANGVGIKPRIEGSRIISDGTILAADDISGVVAILDGLRRVRHSGISHPRIEVVFTVCEEQGVTGSKYIDYTQIQAKHGYVLDSPGRLGRVVNAAPAKAQLSFYVHGRNAHAGNAPEKGINAVIVAANVLTNLKDGRIDQETTCNFSTFNAQGPTNVVNAYAFVHGEARSRDIHKLENCIREFETTCADIARISGARIETKVDHDYTCFNVPLSAPSICLLESVFKKMGITMSIEAGGGGMDANRFNANGIECVGVATGYGANHTCNEHVEIEDLIRSGEMVEQIIREERLG